MKGSSFSLFRWSPYDFALWLQNCLKGKALRPGMQVHCMLLTTGMDMNIFSLNSKLVGMYASCADVKSAEFVFGQIQYPNVFAFNWMVLTLAFNGYYEDALGYFRSMREQGHKGNTFTFSIILKACIGLMDINKGKEVHAMAYKMDFHNDTSTANAFIDMYCKCGRASYATHVFDKMTERDVASWTSMICGFSNIGKFEQALVLFERMKLEGLQPNNFTWNTVLAGYARSKDSKKAFEFITRMRQDGFVPDLVSWNALISCLVRNYNDMKAFKLFREMLSSRIQPNCVTVAALLPACGSICSIKWGRELHGFICRKGFDVNVFIASALIDMYSRCGSLRGAQNVFDKIPKKNVASWNAMIGCYGKCGMVDSAIELFEKMHEEGLEANEITLTCLLSACSHSGSVEKGLEIFRLMKECYEIEISSEHYACVVDIFCRSGMMVEAYEFLKAMPIEFTESILGAFLNGCKVHGKRDLAKMMVEDITRMELKRPGGFVTLSNIYAADGEWEKVGNVRKVMKEKTIQKKSGFSWLEKMDGILEVKEEKELSNGMNGSGFTGVGGKANSFVILV